MGGAEFGPSLGRFRGQFIVDTSKTVESVRYVF